MILWQIFAINYDKHSDISRANFASLYTQPMVGLEPWVLPIDGKTASGLIELMVGLQHLNCVSYHPTTMRNEYPQSHNTLLKLENYFSFLFLKTTSSDSRNVLCCKPITTFAWACSSVFQFKDGFLLWNTVLSHWLKFSTILLHYQFDLAFPSLW